MVQMGIGEGKEKKKDGNDEKQHDKTREGRKMDGETVRCGGGELEDTQTVRQTASLRERRFAEEGTQRNRGKETATVPGDRQEWSGPPGVG